MRLSAIAMLLSLSAISSAQWQMLETHSTADFRGVANVGKGVVWISGNHGTVLRSEDAGYLWQHCTTPPGAEHLDFRGIQAFDANTAIVMSSGKGDLSRLYKTTDGCQTWKLVFVNPDKDGFWDDLFVEKGQALLIGDPVASRFQIYAATDAELLSWKRIGERSSFATFKFDLDAYPGETLFAASNSVLRGSASRGILFVSGGSLGAKFSFASWRELDSRDTTYMSFKAGIPLSKGGTAGAFSFGTANQTIKSYGRLVVVGGDYAKPDDGNGTAAWSKDGGQHWFAANKLPGGYRSAVAYDEATRAWITVGPNGTDVSLDDGRSWRALRPGVGDAVDANMNWNALSLPYVVGPHGRVGMLEPAAVK